MATEINRPTSNDAATPRTGEASPDETANAQGEMMMAQAAAAGAAATGQGSGAIQPPAANEKIEIAVQPGQQVQLGFDPAQAQATLADGNLVLTFPNGGQIVLTGFEGASAAANPVAILLPDGTLLAGNVVVASIGGGASDISTAAAGGPAGHGANQYGDDLGSPIGLIDHGPVLPPTDQGIFVPTAEEEPILPEPTLGVSFAIKIANFLSQEETPGSFGQSVVLKEENFDSALVQVSLNGGPIEPGESAMVTVTISGDTENNAGQDFIQNVINALINGANGAGIDAVDNMDGTVTLTWDSGDPSSFDVFLTANDDNFPDSPETLTLTLSDPVLSNGGASVADGMGAVDATINDMEAAQFSIKVNEFFTEEGGTFDQSASINEPGGSLGLPHVGTFLIALNGVTLEPGNTASVTVTMSGTAEDADFNAAVIQSIATAATNAGIAVSGQDGDSLVLTWGAGDPTSFTVNMTALGDDFPDSPETLTLSLSDPEINGAGSDASASIMSGMGSADLTIHDDDTASFAIKVAEFFSDEGGHFGTFDQAATINEESNPTQGTYRISMAGVTLQDGDTASVTVTMSGTADDADFNAAVIQSIATAATNAGIAVSGQDGDSLVLTWGAGDPLSFDVDLTAFNDQMTDSPETLTLTLSSPSISAGGDASAEIASGMGSADLTIHDIDVDAAFAIKVAENFGDNEFGTFDQAASINEEDNPTVGTYRISLDLNGGTLSGGNTASVTVTMSGDAENADFNTAVIAAIANAAGGAGIAVSEQDGDSLVLTWGAGDPLSFDIDMSAFNDLFPDSPETLTLTLSGATVTNGSAEVMGGMGAADLTINDTDAAAFAIKVQENLGGGEFGTLDQSATIYEEPTGGQTDDARYVISLSGVTLEVGDTASVTVTMSGTAEDADFTAAVIQAVATAATNAGIAVSGQDADSLVLTWGNGDPLSFNVDLTAVNDAFPDSPETLTLTLSTPLLNGSGSSASITSGMGSADVVIHDTETASFAIKVQENLGGGEFGTLDQSATIYEEPTGGQTDDARYVISMSGVTLQGTDTASITVTMSGDAEDADFTAAVIQAVATAATNAGIAVSGQDADSLVLTWGAGDPLSFNVDLTAVNDAFPDSPETLTLTLSSPSISAGGDASAEIASGMGSADLTIHDTETASFAIKVQENLGGGEFGTLDQSATIYEEPTGGQTADGRYVISMSGVTLQGSDTAAITITMSGDAENADFNAAVIQAVATAATNAGIAVSGQTGTTVTLTWGAGDPLSFNVDLSAVNDAFPDSPETLTLTMSSPTINAGSDASAVIASGMGSADLTINDTDAVVFNISSTSELGGDNVVTEGNVDDDTGTFTISYTGVTLEGSDTVSVQVDVNGGSTADDGVDLTPSFEAALIAAVGGTETAPMSGIWVNAATGISYDSNTNVLTFSALGTAETSLDIDLTAVDDGMVEMLETFTVDLSNAELNGSSANASIGTGTASLDIEDNDIFPAGLAYMTAGGSGGGGPAHTNLYAVDLETGATVEVGPIVVSFNGTDYDKMQFQGLSLNPDDGFLYAIGKSGSFSGLVMIDPITADSTVIGGDNPDFDGSAGGLSFQPDGTLWGSFGDKIGTIDLSTGLFTEVVDLPNNVSVAAFEISADGTTAYVIDGVTLYVIDLTAEGADGTITPGELAADAFIADVGFSLNGLSFDDSGILWGTDNAGAIVRFDLDAATVEQVTTIANSDVTSSGIKNLAISIENPGTYVNVSGGGQDYTVFVDHTDFDPDGTDLAINLDNNHPAGLFGFDNMSTPFTPDEVTIDRLMDGTLVFTDTTDANSPDVDTINIRNDDEALVKVVGFDNVEVLIGGGDTPSALTVEGVQNGTLLTLGTLSNGNAVETGSSADTVLIKADDNGGPSAVVVKTGAGNDQITLDGTLGDDLTLFNIDGGTGDDTLFLLNQNTGTGEVLLDLRGIETIDMTSTNAEITLTPSDVLDTGSVVAFGADLPLTHTMVIEGDAGDTVNVLNSDGWTFDSNDGTYNIYTATVNNVPVDQFDMDSNVFTTVETVNVTLMVDQTINDVVA